MSRAGEVKAVASKVDQLLNELNDTVAALNAMLTAPKVPPDGDAQ